MARYFLAFGVVMISLVRPSQPARAEETIQHPPKVAGQELSANSYNQTEFIHMPASLLGPSGLIFTQSTDTLAPGRLELGIGINHQHSSIPNYVINEVSPTLTLGLPKKLEFSAHLPYLFDFGTRGSHEDAREDLDASLKWRFLDQNGERNLPSLGLSLTYFFPFASDNNPAGVHFGLINHWGFRALLLSSAEIDLLQPVASYVVGVYLDGGTFVRDIGTTFGEKHGIVDAGVILPLTGSRQLQLILEGNFTFRDKVQFEGNYDGLTGALRFVTPHFNISAGVQHRFMLDAAVNDTDRLFIQGSYLF